MKSLILLPLLLIVLPASAVFAKPSVADLHAQAQAAAQTHLPGLSSQSEAARGRFSQVESIAAPKAKNTLPPAPQPGQLNRAAKTGGAQ